MRHNQFSKVIVSTIKKSSTNFLVGTLIAAGTSTANAEDVAKYDLYRASCKTNVQCFDFDVRFQKPKVLEPAAQRTRFNTNHSESSRKKIYIGGNLGLTFPGELGKLEVSDSFEFINGDFVPVNVETVDPSKGYGGSIFGGFNFTDVIGGDLELFIFAGGTEPVDDSYYIALGVFVNPRFTFLLNPNSSKSPYAYISPGIGVIYAFLSEEIEDEILGDDNDNVRGIQGTSFGVQLKAGLGLPISETLHFFGQARYFNGINIFEIEGTGGDFENQSFDSLGLEAGISLNFGN